MRGRKHPLEVYQRASPFTGWEEKQEPRTRRRRTPRVRRTPRLPRRPDWLRFPRLRRRLVAGLDRVRGRLGGMPLGRVVRVAIPLVLIAVVIYAVRFWPGGGDGGSEDPSLQRNEWRDPLGDAAGQDSSDQAATGTGADQGGRAQVYLQLASAAIHAISTNPSLQALHVDDVRRWQEEAGRIQRALAERTRASGLGDLGLEVQPWHTDTAVGDDIRLVVGPWAMGDPDILSLLGWLKENGFEDAQVWEP